EPAELELPLGRAPPRGAVLEVRAEAKLPRGRSHGFDERTWLRRHGIHVVLAGDSWRVVGHRHGLGRLGDRLHNWLGGSVAGGLHGERRGVLLGVVLGDEQGLGERLRNDFRASGLYHLLAVSGQNVALVASGALVLAWLLGIPRWLGQLAALASIGGYVLAVGPQPSVLRAGVAGALGSLAWLTARPTDRWYFLLLGALALLAWNPYVLFDAGFQLSFAAVVAILLPAPRIAERLEGYPLPKTLREVIALSTACGVATAPILWVEFHAIPVLPVPANAAAAPAVVPPLGLAVSPAAVPPFAPGLFVSERRLEVVEHVENWKAAAVQAVVEYLTSPSPETVLALVGEGVRTDLPLGKAVAKTGELLVYDLPKRGTRADLPGWVGKQFAGLGIKVDSSTSRLLVDLVGDNLDELAGEIEKLAAWAKGEPIGEREVE